MHRFRPGRRGHLSNTVFFAICMLFLACVGLAGCGGDASTATTVGPGDSESVTFVTADSVTLDGHLFGTGTSGIVLAHMYPSDQTSWYTTAEKLAKEGYLVLTFDFRGYGESEGSRDIKFLDRDVFAAVQKIASAGATKVALVGASMGGTASLMAAGELFAGQVSSADVPAVNITLAGVATLSAPVAFKGLSAADSVPKIYCPLLFIAAEDDVGASGAMELQGLSGNTGDLQIVPGKDHGTDLLDGSEADRVWDLLLGFLTKHLPAAD